MSYQVSSSQKVYIRGAFFFMFHTIKNGIISGFCSRLYWILLVRVSLTVPGFRASTNFIDQHTIVVSCKGRKRKKKTIALPWQTNSEEWKSRWTLGTGTDDWRRRYVAIGNRNFCSIRVHRADLVQSRQVRFGYTRTKVKNRDGKSPSSLLQWTLIR